MPTASEEDREWATKKFGSIDCGPVELWLVEQGLVLTKGWLWYTSRPYDKLTEDEKRAIVFLIDEWDYGGLTFESPDPHTIRLSKEKLKSPS